MVKCAKFVVSLTRCLLWFCDRKGNLKYVENMGWLEKVCLPWRELEVCSSEMVLLSDDIVGGAGEVAEAVV